MLTFEKKEKSQINHVHSHLKNLEKEIKSIPKKKKKKEKKRKAHLSPRTSPGKNTGVGSHSFLQGIFLT